MENNRLSIKSLFITRNPPPFQPLSEENMRDQGMVLPPQSTVVTLETTVTSVKDHLTWSIFNVAYMNIFCLGLLALVFSVKSRDRKLLGDISGSISYGSTARSFNIAATVLSILTVVLLFVLIVTGVLPI